MKSFILKLHPMTENNRNLGGQQGRNQGQGQENTGRGNEQQRGNQGQQGQGNQSNRGLGSSDEDLQQNVSTRGGSTGRNLEEEDTDLEGGRGAQERNRQQGGNMGQQGNTGRSDKDTSGNP